jgi:hypothetical protein
MSRMSLPYVLCQLCCFALGLHWVLMHACFALVLWLSWHQNTVGPAVCVGHPCRMCCRECTCEHTVYLCFRVAVRRQLRHQGLTFVHVFQQIAQL